MGIERRYHFYVQGRADVGGGINMSVAELA